MVSKFDDQAEVQISNGVSNDSVSLIPKEFLRIDEIGLIDYVSLFYNSLVNKRIA